MIVLVPVYQPGPRLTTMIRDLGRALPDAGVVVVDDGSGPAALPVLTEAEEAGCVVLRHRTNLGKGTALKTGLRHARREHPGQDVVSADADGQHGIDDIVRVAERTHDTGHLVLGVREFAGKVPLRSRIGNRLTSRLFHAATGHPVRDTQTGLRGYPAGLLDRLLTVPGERFEYEMNVLLYAAREGRPIDEVTIETTYHDDNSSSHFSALSDSVRIYAPLMRFALLGFSGRIRGNPGM